MAMDDGERAAVRQLLFMFIMTVDHMATAGYDLRGAAGPVAAEVSSLLGVSNENRPDWVRQAAQ